MVQPREKKIKDKKNSAFVELWGEITATGNLPDMASLVMSQAFSEETKEALLKSKKSASELADLLNRVIEAIDNGSIVKIDELVRKELKR